MHRPTRLGFLRGAAAGGSALAVGVGMGWPAAPALGASSEQDLAWVRFGITVEFVSAEYYRRARRTGFFSPRESRALERATAAQLAHLRSFRRALLDAGEAPIDEADLEVVLPDKSFTTRQRTVTLGRRIEGIALHAYLGAVETVQDAPLRRLLGQACASEAEQRAFLTGLAGPVITDPFPSVHGLGTAAEELARYLP